MVGVRTQGRYHVEALNRSAAEIDCPEGSPARGERSESKLSGQENPRERNRAAVRAVIVVMKRGNARGAKGGRKVERPRP
jgi:hypothetical protein